MNRIRLALAAAAIAVTTPAVAIAAPTVTAHPAPTVEARPEAPSNYCSDRRITRYGGTWYGGIASCSGLRVTRWRLVLVCYGSNKLQGFPTYVRSAEITGSRSNVTVWCPSAKRYGYDTYVIFLN